MVHFSCHLNLLDHALSASHRVPTAVERATASMIKVVSAAGGCLNLVAMPAERYWSFGRAQSTGKLNP